MTEREQIAEYVKTVARQAYMRGFSAGWSYGANSARVSVDRAIQREETESYVRSGFDVETVAAHHPGMRPETPE